MLDYAACSHRRKARAVPGSLERSTPSRHLGAGRACTGVPRWDAVDLHLEARDVAGAGDAHQLADIVVCVAGEIVILPFDSRAANYSSQAGEAARGGVKVANIGKRAGVPSNPRQGGVVYSGEAGGALYQD